jgi:hypothetical protein
VSDDQQPDEAESVDDSDSPLTEQPTLPPQKASDASMDEATLPPRVLDIAGSTLRATGTVLAVIIGFLAAVCIFVFSFPGVNLAAVGDVVVSIGIGFVSTLALIFITMSVTAILWFVLKFFRWLKRPSSIHLPPNRTGLFVVFELFPFLTSGIGGGIVCVRLIVGNPIGNLCGLAIVLVIFWVLVFWLKPRFGCSWIVASQILGIFVGGLIQHLVAV